MIKTRITELLGIERPILQGGMMWLARSELAAAVGNAGGIGFMTALTYPDAEGLRDEIRKTRTMTDKPFGINLTFLPTLRPPDYPSYIQVCIDEGVKVIETAGIELEQLGRDAGQAAAKAEEQSFFDSITSSFNNLDVKAKFERMKDRAAEVIEHLIELSVVFILQTAVLPMVFLWGLVQVFKRAFVWRLNGNE